MLYTICPSCQTLLSHIQIPYKNDVDLLFAKYAKKYNDNEREIKKDANFIKENEAILNKYVDNWCCKMRVISYCPLVTIIQ